MTPRTLPSLPQYSDDAVTRLLCAHTHLDENFAMEALEEFTADRIKAVGLPLGINLIALVRHAGAAQRRRRSRDAQLAVLLSALVACLLAALVSLGNGLPDAAAGFGIAAAVVLAAAWFAIHHCTHFAWIAAREVYRGQRKPQDLAPPLEKETEDHLKSLRQANVVAYDARLEADTPFVGSGDFVTEFVWPSVDVSRPAENPAGGTLVKKPFDAVDLHAYMAREMSGIAGLDGLRARNRLYVRGLHVPSLGPQLLPDATRHPLTRIDKQLVQSGVVREGGGMRTYLSLEMVGHGGKYVMSMHLRARLVMDRLSWSVAAYVLPPVDEHYAYVAYLPLGGFEEWWQLTRHTATSLRWMLLSAPGRMLRRRSRRAAHARDLRKIRREITKHKVAYDYGALDSLRERVAQDTDRMNFDQRMDASDAFQRLQQGALIATKRFLVSHNVDASDLDDAQKVINNQTYNIGSISGNHTQVGPNNNQNNAGPGGAGGPGGGAGGGGGTPPSGGGKTT